MPVFVVEHDGALVGQAFQIVYDAVGLLGHCLVEILAGFVVFVDLVAQLKGSVIVLFREQVYGLLTRLYASRSIDAGAYLEDDVVDLDFLVLESTNLNDSSQPCAWIVIYLAQSMICKDSVLAHNGYDVRSDAHSHQVEIGDELAELNAIVLGKGLHQLEAYAAA